MEILWPIILFSILLIVRVTVPPEELSECHYPARALPSSGIFPWFQTLLCNIDNPCFNRPLPSEVPGQVNDPTYEASGSTGFMNVLNTVITETDIVNDPAAFQQDVYLVTTLYNEIAKPDSTIKATVSSLMGDSNATRWELIGRGLSADLSDTILQSRVSLYQVQQLLDSVNRRSIVCDASAVASAITIPDTAPLDATATSMQLCSLSDEQLNAVWATLTANADLQSFYENEGTTLLTEAGTNADVNAIDMFVFVSIRLPILNRQFQTVLGALSQSLMGFSVGGNSTNDILSSVIGIDLSSGAGFQEFCGHPQPRAQISQQAASGIVSVISEANDNSTDATDFCDSLINTFERNENLSFVWTIFKPILFGKIPFAPDTNVTRDIMRRANQTFQAMGDLESISRTWIETEGLGLFEFLENSTATDILRGLLAQNLTATNIITLTESEQELLATLLSNNETSNVPGTVTWKQAFSGMNVAILLLQRFLRCVNLDKFEGFQDETALVDRSMALLENNTFWAGVVFISPTATDTELPNHIKYKIRQDVDDVMRTDFIQNYFWSAGPKVSITELQYLVNGFADLQDMLDNGIARTAPAANGNDATSAFYSQVPKLGYYIQPVPYPCYESDKFLEYLSSMMSLLMTLAWIYSVCIIVKNIVYEKELRLKEFMKMMGLGNGVHWIAWFINSFYLMLVSAVLLLVVLRALGSTEFQYRNKQFANIYGDVLPYSNMFILLIWMMSFCIATIAQCFLISCFFTKANLAAACGGIIYFMLYIPYNFAVTWEGKLTYGGKIGLSLFSTVAFGFGADFVTKYEMSGQGIQFSNWNISPEPGEQYTFLVSLVMMLVDAVIYFLLTWYVENVFPGKYGIPRPPYFMFTSSYWCGPSKIVNDVTEFDSPTPGRGGEFVEDEPQNTSVGVSIQHLTKIYKNGNKLAVDDLTINFYEGQITSFLGHNGAGKTTTMSILCGLFTPTSGTAYIHGQDIRTNMEVVRENLGMCPQHNVLFGDLTVEEHLNFYAALRGLSKKDIKKGTDRMLVDVNLVHKRKDVISSLSGGMKRKLSVAVAFTGNSNTVILDEPTAGVDPYARRGIWDLLIKYREGRTIILSTHHMDEADLLGDRIAIISQGKLKCCGSSLYLRSTFGVGYYLTVVKQKNSRKALEEDVAVLNVASNQNIDEGFVSAAASCKSSLDDVRSANPAESSLVTAKGALDIIRKFVPAARIHEENVGEATFVLPYSAMGDGMYASLFQSLDQNEMTYGLTDTSLEEIFLSVADHPKDESKPDDSCCSCFPKFRRSNSKSMTDHRSEDTRKVEPIQLKRVSKLNQDQESKTCFEETHPAQLERVEEEDEEDAELDEAEIGNGKGSFRVVGQYLVTQQFTALLIKRFLHARRNRKGLFAQIILPSVFVLIALCLTLILPPFEGQPSLELQPWMYGNDLYTFISNDNTSDPDVTSVSDALVNAPGFGTRCVKDYVIDNHVDITSELGVEPYLYCEPVSESFWKTTNETKTLSQNVTSPVYEECRCSTDDEKILLAVCPDGAGGSPTPHKLVNTTDTMFNMTGRDVADWLVKTTDRYIERRYGGLSVGERYHTSFNQTTVGTLVEMLQLFRPNETLIDQQAVGVFLENMWRTQNAKVWFDNNGYHAMPAYMNVLSNGILRSKLPAGADPTEYAITAYSHPLNYTKQQVSQATLAQTALDTSIAIVVIFAMSFVPASFVVFLIDERVTKAKHLQFISGVGQVIYWIANYVWDMINYLVPTAIVIIIFLCFQTEAYVSSANLPCLILLLVFYGWAITPMMYPFSFVFEVSSTAYVVLTCVNLFIGINTTIATLVLDLLDDPHLQDVSNLLQNIFLIFPHFCLGRGLIDMAVNQAMADAYSRFGIDSFKDPLSFEVAGWNIIAMAIEGFVFILLTLLIQYEFFNLFKWRSTSGIAHAAQSSVPSDEDVDAERLRVKTMLDGSEILRVDDLCKVYQKGPFRKSLLAVDRMNVAVSGGECFGLLGVNGAGKTTTFKMLTGDIEPTAGDATVCGHSIIDGLRVVQQSSGYCPQFDALNSHLTGFEHLQLFARLRGVPPEEVDDVAHWGINKLGLKHYAFKTAGTYSGGNKRKLSAAIAFMGCPPIIFLDEPTAGMDPGARRFLWKRILEVVRGRDERCVVLTSHSMEECEALCTRLAIMVNGRFMCVGTPQHLKNKYGKGYTLSVRVGGNNPNMDRVENYLMEAFDGAEVKEKHHNMLVIQLHPGSVKLAEVFQHIESNKAEMAIEDYSLNQTTLDEVFVSFAKHQTDGMDDAVVHTNTDLETKVMPPDSRNMNVYGNLESPKNASDEKLYQTIV